MTSPVLVHFFQTMLSQIMSLVSNAVVTFLYVEDFL